MYGSAIEHETREWIARLRIEIRTRDRGVLLGLFLSVVPVPPVALMGIAVDTMNLRLLARGRLAARERRLVRNSLILGLVSFALGVVLFAGFAHLVAHGVVVAVDLIGHVWHGLGLLMDRLLTNGTSPPEHGVRL
jgi:hypothetical protein